MNPHHYILDAKGNPAIEPDLEKWAHWYQTAKRRRHVGNDFVGPYRISTVFLGLDHNFGDGSPILWETMVFRQSRNKKPTLKSGDWEDLYQDRCAGSREQAEAMHAKMVKKVKASMKRKRVKR
jgi:hypothetical protein